MILSALITILLYSITVPFSQNLTAITQCVKPMLIWLNEPLNIKYIPQSLIKQIVLCTTITVIHRLIERIENFKLYLVDKFKECEYFIKHVSENTVERFASYIIVLEICASMILANVCLFILNLFAIKELISLCRIDQYILRHYTPQNKILLTLLTRDMEGLIYELLDNLQYASKDNINIGIVYLISVYLLDYLYIDVWLKPAEWISDSAFEKLENTLHAYNEDIEYLPIKLSIQVIHFVRAIFLNTGKTIDRIELILNEIIHSTNKGMHNLGYNLSNIYKRRTKS